VKALLEESREKCERLASDAKVRERQLQELRDRLAAREDENQGWLAAAELQAKRAEQAAAREKALAARTAELEAALQRKEQLLTEAQEWLEASRREVELLRTRNSDLEKSLTAYLESPGHGEGPTTGGDENDEGRDEEGVEERGGEEERGREEELIAQLQRTQALLQEERKLVLALK